ncbi:hypothetical protein D3C83_257020 [compost metagenome]
MLRYLMFGLFAFSAVWWWAHTPGAPPEDAPMVEKSALVDLDDEVMTAAAIHNLFDQ